MGKRLWLFIFLSGLTISCLQFSDSNEESRSFTESHPSFFELRHGDWTKNKWIRKPENLIMVHETFKKVGYINLIGPYLSDNPLAMQDIYINKKPHHLIDSLLLTYNQPIVKDKYYREFWSRRRAERNDSIVYLILNDIKFSYQTKFASGSLQLDADTNRLNDTLWHLLKIEYRGEAVTPKTARQDFETLRKLGFHQSAYNLLFQIYRYQDIDWDREELAKSLHKADERVDAWFEDDTK
jgi:hypothetical protein